MRVVSGRHHLDPLDLDYHEHHLGLDHLEHHIDQPEHHHDHAKGGAGGKHMMRVVDIMFIVLIILGSMGVRGVLGEGTSIIDDKRSKEQYQSLPTDFGVP